MDVKGPCRIRKQAGKNAGKDCMSPGQLVGVGKHSFEVIMYACYDHRTQLARNGHTVRVLTPLEAANVAG